MFLALPFPPALVQVQAPTNAKPIPSTVEPRPGIFVVQGAPTPGTFAALKDAGITQVLNLRTATEGDFSFEEADAKAAGASYTNLPIGHPPSSAALDAFRAKMRSLPKGTKVLIHCASGNRAAAALLTYWTLDQGMPLPEAQTLAEKSGLTSPGLERAVMAYIQERKVKP